MGDWGGGGGVGHSDPCVFVFLWLIYCLGLCLWLVCHCYEVFLTQWGLRNVSLMKPHMGGAAGVTVS